MEGRPIDYEKHYAILRNQLERQIFNYTSKLAQQDRDRAINDFKAYFPSHEAFKLVYFSTLKNEIKSKGLRSCVLEYKKELMKVILEQYPSCDSVEIDEEDEESLLKLFESVTQTLENNTWTGWGLNLIM
jgi:hypothetical protein